MARELPQDAFPLADARVGQRLCLLSIRGGRRLALRLAELGLTPGIEFVLIQDSGGPLLLSVRNSRLALGRGVARKMAVRSIG